MPNIKPFRNAGLHLGACHPRSGNIPSDVHVHRFGPL